MAGANVLMHIAHRNCERIFRDIDNPLDYLNDDAIVSKYRLSRPLGLVSYRGLNFGPNLSLVRGLTPKLIS